MKAKRARVCHWLFAVLATVGVLFTGQAMAFTAPVATDFLYDGYDIVFNKIIFGPGGWIGAGLLILFGISQIINKWLVGVLCLVGAAMVIKLQTIMTSLGALIN